MTNFMHFWINTFSVLFSFEMVFVLSLRAGRFKADPRFQSFPIDLTLFFLSISTIAAIYIIIKKRFIFLKRGLLYSSLFMLLVLIAAFSIFWTPSISYSHEKIFKLSTICFFCVFSASMIIGVDSKRIRRFLICLVLVDFWIASEIGIASINHTAGQFLNALAPEGTKGMYQGLSAVLNCLTLILIIYVSFPFPQKKYHLISLFLIPFLFFLILEVGARGPLFCMIAVVTGILVLKFIVFIRPSIVKLSKKNIFGMVTGIIILMGTIFIFFPALKTNIEKSTTFRRVIFLFKDGGRGAFDNQRLIYYHNALEMFREQPVYGWGIGAFPIVMGDGDQENYPHNIVLEVLAELGTIGGILFGTFLLLPFLSINYNLFQCGTLENTLIVGLFLFYFLWSFISGTITGVRELYVFASLLFVARCRGD